MMKKLIHRSLTPIVTALAVLICAPVMAQQAETNINQELHYEMLLHDLHTGQAEFDDLYQFNAENMANLPVSNQDLPEDQNFSDQFYLPGLDGSVSTITEYGNTFCIGGGFISYDGDIRLNHVACWNEEQENWEALGEGFNSTVSALIEFEGDLYAGGSFTFSGDQEVNRIARWSGNEWEQVGNGLNESVQSFHVYNGELIMGGPFTHPGTSLDGEQFAGIYTIRQEELAPSGSVARDFGTGWLFNDQQEFESELSIEFTGRSFTAAPTPASGFDLSEQPYPLGFFEEDGTGRVSLVENVGTGLSCAGGPGIYYGPAESTGEYDPSDDSEFTFAIRENILEDCGKPAFDIEFTATKTGSSKMAASSDGIALNGIARWDGNSIKPMGSGLIFDNSPNVTISTITDYNGKIFVGGETSMFTSEGLIFEGFLKYWNEETELWSSYLEENSDFGFRVLYSYEDDLYAAGAFSSINGSEFPRIARWNNNTENWEQVGDGFNSNVTDITEFNGDLYASGFFTFSGEQEIRGLAKWDETSSNWVPALVDNLESLSVLSLLPVDDKLAVGLNFESFVNSIYNFGFFENGNLSPERAHSTDFMGLSGFALYTHLFNDQVIVSGNFNSVGPEPANSFAIWTDSGWEPMELAEDINTPLSSRAMTTFQDELIAGTTDGRLLIWDEALNEWQLLADGESGFLIWRIIEFDDQLFIAGGDDGSPIVPRVLRWNSDTEELDLVGEEFSGTRIRGMTVFNDQLYIGGTFSNDDETIQNIARWDSDSESWETAGEVPGNVYAFAEYEGELYAGGPGTNVIKWDDDTETWIDFSNGIEGSTWVNDLLVYEGEFYINGGDLELNNLGRWDSEAEQWVSLGSGINDLSYQMTGLNGKLHIPGFFTEAGGRPAHGFTIYDTGTGVFVDEPGSEHPKSVALAQNYPNPFNPSTVISYQIPVNSEVRLEVFDMLGRRVATLVNEHKTAGVHEVQFDASALSSGIYFYRLQAGDFVEARQMVLVK